MAPPSGVIVEAPSEETMASGTPLLPFEVNGSAIALNNPADQVYIYTPATIVSGGITSEPDVTVTISSLTGVLTGGPAGSTGDGTDFLSFSITASGLGIVYPVEFQGLTLTEPGNVTADQLVITVADGIDPVVTRRIAIEVLPVPDLVLPGTISAIAGEVMQLTGLSITDPDATNLILDTSGGELAAPGLGIDVVSGAPYASHNSNPSNTILAALDFSALAPGLDTIDVGAIDQVTGSTVTADIVVNVVAFAATAAQPLLVGGLTLLDTSDLVGGTTGAGFAVTVDGGGTLDLGNAATLSAPAGLAVGVTGSGLLVTQAGGAALSPDSQLSFASLVVGAGADAAGEVDIGVGALGAGSGGVIGQAGSGLLIGEQGSSLGFGFGGALQYGVIPYRFELAAAAYGIAGGPTLTSSLVLGAQAGAVGVLDTDGTLGVIGNLVVGQNGGQGALLLEGEAAISGTLMVGGGSFVRADQGLLPGALALAAGGIFIAEGNSVVPGQGDLYPQPTILNTQVTGAGTLAIVPGAALDLGVGATISAATTIDFLRGVDTAGQDTNVAPSFDKVGDTGGQLIINPGASVAGVIAGYRSGDVITFLGANITGTSTSADATPGVVDLTVSYADGSGTSDIVLRLLDPQATGYAGVIETAPYAHSGQVAALTPVVALPGDTAAPTGNLQTPASLSVVAGISTPLLGLALVETASLAFGQADTLTIATQSGTLSDPSLGGTWTPASPFVSPYFSGEALNTELAQLIYTPAAGQTSDSITVTAVTGGGTFVETIPVTISSAAQSFVWQGGVGGDFQAAGSWRVAGNAATEAPTSGDTITFGPGLALVTTSGAAALAMVTGTVEFEQGLALTGPGDPLTVAGGMAVFAPNSTFSDSASIMVSSGVLEVDTQAATAGPVTVGSGSGDEGVLRLGPYGLLSIGTLTLGATTGSDGQAELDGQFVLSGSLLIGEAGTGSVTFAGNDNNIVTSAVVLGDQSGASGVLSLAGGGLTAHQSITVGNAGSGTLVESNGVLSLAGALNVAAAAGSSGKVILDGGTITVSKGYSFNSTADQSLYVGGSAAGSGGAGTLELGVGDNAGGILTVGGSTEIFAHGTIAMDGGWLLSPLVSIKAGGMLSGNGVVFLGNVVTYPENHAGAPLATIKNAGTIAPDGDLLLYATVTGAGAMLVGAGDTLEIQGSASGGSVGFTAAGGLLRLDQADGFADSVSAFQPGDTLDLPDVSFAGVSGLQPGAGTTEALVTSTGTLDFQFAAGTPPLLAQSDASGGTQIVAVACFVRGTRIATARGAVAVEDLAPGTSVCAQNGRLAPVAWIGRRVVDCRRHPDPRAVWPVRVAAGAFGFGRPARDLYLSPDHAVFADGVLIPVKHLIDGRGIAPVAVDRVEYWHVELDRHDVLLAEGLPCESFLDTGQRGAFAGGGVVQLHPEFAGRAWDGAACAELVVAGPVLARVRARLRRSLRAAG